MEISMAANFLAGTILVSMGIIVMIGCIVIINNIVSKFWKPVKVAVFHSLMTDKVDGDIIQVSNKPTVKETVTSHSLKIK